MFHKGNTSLPLSAYSSLIGATSIPASSSPSSSSTPTPQASQTTAGQQSPTLQNPYHVKQTLKDATIIECVLDIGTRQFDPDVTLSPALMNINPYSVPTPYQLSYSSPLASTPQPYNGNVHQYLQPPSVVNPAMLSRSPHDFSNGLANRTAATQPEHLSRPESTSIVAEAAVHSPSTPGASTPGAGPSNLPNLSTSWLDILTSKNINDSPRPTARSMISLLLKSDWKLIDCATRVEILTRIRDNAGKDFYSVWANDADARDLLTEWLKTPLKQQGWDDTMMPLLSVGDNV